MEKIKRGEHVSRGTLQTEFLYYSYNELWRLGLTEEMEEECRARNPAAAGLLGVAMVLKGGPAGHQREGAGKGGAEMPVPEGPTEPLDWSLAIPCFTCSGKYIIEFIGLWSIIDDSAGKDAVLEIFRAGRGDQPGTTGRLQVIWTVQGLHSITPNRYLEISGSSFHNLSYQMGRNHKVQLGTSVFYSSLFFPGLTP